MKVGGQSSLSRLRNDIIWSRYTHHGWVCQRAQWGLKILTSISARRYFNSQPIGEQSSLSTPITVQHCSPTKDQNFKSNHMTETDACERVLDSELTCCWSLGTSVTTPWVFTQDLRVFNLTFGFFLLYWNPFCPVVSTATVKKLLITYQFIKLTIYQTISFLLNQNWYTTAN